MIMIHLTPGSYQMDKYGNIGVVINGRNTGKLTTITEKYNMQFKDNYDIEVLKYEYESTTTFSKLGQLRLLYMMLPFDNIVYQIHIYIIHLVEILLVIVLWVFCKIN